MMRILAISFVTALLVLHAAAGVGVWRAAVDPASPGRVVGPRSGALTELARLDMQAGLAALADRSRPAAERFAAYQARLRTSRELLVRSLDVNPLQPDALATLATIDYELAPADPETLDRTLERIETAARLAPRVPRVQVQLGELLLRMGQSDEALGYLARGVELEDSLAVRVVRMAASHGVGPDALREALPPRASSLAALRLAVAPDDLDLYLNWVEEAIDSGSFTPTAALLSSYGDAALRIDQASRLADRMAAWGPYGERDLEAGRLMQLARAALRLGDAPGALAWARRGREIDPESYSLAAFLGDAARAASQPELAIQAYRDGLGLLARGSANPRARAYLYRRIGEVHEDTHRLDLAYDAYAKALEIFPEEPYARARMGVLSGSEGL